MTRRAMCSPNICTGRRPSAPVRYHLASSEVPHFRLDRFPIDISDLELDGASRYRYPPLREAIARKCGVSPDRVVMADGTSMANMLAMAALIAPGDEVLVEHPAYEPMVAAAHFLGAEAQALHPRGAGLRARSRRGRGGDDSGDPPDPAHQPAQSDGQSRRRGDAGVGSAALGAHVLIDEVYLDAACESSAAPPRRRLRHHLQPDQGLRPVRPALRLDPRRARACRADVAAQRIVRRRPGPSRRAPLLHRARAARRDRARGAWAPARPQPRARQRLLRRAAPTSRRRRWQHGITAFPRLVRGDVDALDALLRARYDTAIVPGRFFGLADHFRIGVGGPTEMVEAGLERLGAALDELE